MAAQPDYTTILAPAGAEFVEKRSRFLSELRPVTTQQEAAAFVAEQRARYHDARHNCSAFVLRDGVMRYSDDGEPQGTAGVPMLEVLRREGLVDVCVVVTRYFGGILLGAGGLVRAYSHSAKLAVDAAQRVRMCLCATFRLAVPYPLYGTVETLLQKRGVTVLDSDFAQQVTLHLRTALPRLEGLAAELTELSGGTLSPELTGEVFAADTSL